MRGIQLKLMDTDRNVVVARAKGVRRGRGAEHMVTEDALTLGEGHIVQRADLVSQKCMLGTCMLYI